MGYMVRLGLWGAANPSFPAFADFMAAMGSRGMAALELVHPPSVHSSARPDGADLHCHHWMRRDAEHAQLD